MHNLITFSIVFTKKKFFFFLKTKNLMNLYSQIFYLLNFKKKKKIMVKETQNQEFTGESQGLVRGRDFW